MSRTTNFSHRNFRSKTNMLTKKFVRSCIYNNNKRNSLPDNNKILVVSNNFFPSQEKSISYKAHRNPIEFATQMHSISQLSSKYGIPNCRFFFYLSLYLPAKHVFLLWMCSTTTRCFFSFIRNFFKQY